MLVSLAPSKVNAIGETISMAGLISGVISGLKFFKTVPCGGHLTFTT